jgi:hypothetical protein
MGVQLDRLNHYDRTQLRMGHKTDLETVEALLDRIEELEGEVETLKSRTESDD